ncbi:conjugal transfer protein TraD [Chryseobacterium cucumeris]|uniref:Conjugal transfer protein TraD n=1 Tax=Chryseobacterium cucumeris TaxID=1813611 RepID=A0ABX9XBW1_9FLAO|nr:conjugal transfer protein TraD [Chryseobacterium cucumeris]MDH5033861.1 conjugal transfer protein TraD [Chryseobacterium cucumeris]ROH94890.1 conjugal transfer protein TraD [Chryseobacterium cucumeris]
METLIIICLLTIILLLLYDKIIEKQFPSHKTEKHASNKKQPNIMGEAKTSLHSMTMTSSERQENELGFDPSNLDIEYDISENVNLLNPQEDPDNFSSIPDFIEEEEEWKKYRIISEDNSIAQGVTFEELSTVEMFVKQNSFTTSQKETATAIVQKTYGTELYILLENSMENDSHKIALLLDKSFYSENDSDSSF